MVGVLLAPCQDGRIDRSLDLLPIGVFTTSPDGRLTEANDAFRTLVLGGGPITMGAAPWANAQPTERAAAELTWQRSRDEGTPFTCEFRVWRPDGEAMWIQVATQAVTDATGAVTGFVGTALDVTEAVARRALSERLVGLLDSSTDAVLVFDPRGELLFCNDGARALVGVDERSTAHDATTQLFIRAILDQVPREITSSTTSNRWDGEIGFRSPDGIMRTMSIALQMVRAKDGTIQHFSAIARDITDAKQMQDELTRQATHDALTGLPNRVLFLRKLAEALERSRTLKRGVAVLFVDLDKLKDVNDNIGHGVGDQLLNTIAKRLVAATRPSDLVARIGGDEFVVLCDGLSDEHIAMDVAERVRQAMTGQVIIQGIEIFTSASVGIALATDSLLEEESPADAAVTLLRNADTAMYRAKQRGRGRSELYSDEMRQHAKERAALSAELERALALDEMFVVYQPVVSAQTSRVAGVEVLLRWRHRTRGVLTPPAFLDLADESGIIGPIGDWVIRRACADARTWIDQGIVERTFHVHANVSVRQLGDSTFVERLMGAINESGLDAMNVVLEVTEKVMLSDNPTVTRTLSALKRLGVKLAIDDFGTGYSSLARLREFPADFLKLDGTLVRDIGTQASDDPIVRSIIQLAHSLNMSVIAEWVTTDDHTHRLRILGCDFLQGNRIGEPVLADEFGSRTRQQQSR
jgi:diguanylate cyclase (GGDEF)-like protein/PAS domain S-box-containing protein